MDKAEFTLSAYRNFSQKNLRQYTGQKVYISYFIREA